MYSYSFFMVKEEKRITLQKLYTLQCSKCCCLLHVSEALVDKNVTFLFCSNLPKPGLHPHAWPYTTSQPTRSSSQPTRSSSQPTPYSSVRTTYSTGRPTRMPWPYPTDRPTDSDSNIDQQLATSYKVIQ
jgi:hypothetical protein